MPERRPPDLASGGAYAWQLPWDDSGPAVARALLMTAMATLGLDPELIDDGRLAVSETATNAFRHARPATGQGAVVPPELWIWARTVSSPQLVVSVFDSAHAALPRTSDAGLLDEHGKGLQLLGAVAAAWGCHVTRSRLAIRPARGKAVWFSLPLPAAWPGRACTISPADASVALFQVLRSRGVQGSRRSDEAGVSVLHLPGVDVWVRPADFSWLDDSGRYARRPLTDLHHTAEELVRLVEERRDTSRTQAPARQET